MQSRSLHAGNLLHLIPDVLDHEGLEEVRSSPRNQARELAKHQVVVVVDRIFRHNHEVLSNKSNTTIRTVQCQRGCRLLGTNSGSATEVRAMMVVQIVVQHSQLVTEKSLVWFPLLPNFFKKPVTKEALSLQNSLNRTEESYGKVPGCPPGWPEALARWPSLPGSA